jgi:hypothetical protein
MILRAPHDDSQSARGLKRPISAASDFPKTLAVWLISLDVLFLAPDSINLST